MMMKTFLLAIVLPSALLGLCSAQAPGDEDRQRCMESSTYSHPYPDNWKILMDSWNYEQLLPGHSGLPIAGAVWTDASCDSNDNAQFPRITPPYWHHGGGGICRFQAQVCGYSVGPQNNWLFTQHISKAVPTTDSYTVRVFVNVTYGFQSCRTRNRCNPQFRVLKYITNSQQQRDTCSDTSLYSGSGIMPNNTVGSESTDGLVSDLLYFDMTTSQDGLYLALHDTTFGNLRGTCVGVNRLTVYRHECHAQIVGLVRYPATQAPVSGTVSVQTECVDNAHRSSSSLSVRCDSDGHWSSGSPECECDLGYREVTESGNQVCEGCPAGTYRSSGDTECQPCPANTMRDQVATDKCQCQDGYFRNDAIRDNTCRSFLTASTEGAGTGCTQPPHAPNSMVVSAVSARSIRVTWLRPSQTGGRSDLYYTVEHSNHDDPLGQYIGMTCKVSSSTSHTFTGLRPGTKYCIHVSAHNGVSDQDPDGAHLRTIEKCTTTPESFSSSVIELQIFYPVVVWQSPTQPNGVILEYQLIFTRSGESRTQSTTLTYYVIDELRDLPGLSGNFTVEVKPQNSAGAGQSTLILSTSTSDCTTIPSTASLPVIEMLQSINILLGSLVTKSNTQLRQVYQIVTDLGSLKDLTSLHQNLTNNLANQLERVQHYLESDPNISNMEVMNAEKVSNLTHQLETIQRYLESDPSLPVHTCGGTGGWRRVVYLDMTDPSTTCPSGWQLTGHSKRTCGRVSTTSLSCDSVTFPVSGGEYSRVCGRIKAYQFSQTDAFEAYHEGRVTTIDGAYVAGVSLTYGTLRRHIWTFTAGASEANPTWIDACPCDASITIRVPPFVGNDYFCESGRNTAESFRFFPDDPLWDGQNCTSSSTCCSFNTPPYFVKQLPTSTTDSIEARLCQLDGHDSPVELLELYVQ